MTIIQVKLIPNAKREEVVGDLVSGFKIRVTAPAVDNKANQALINLLAKHLGVKKSSLCIAKGDRSRNKTIRLLI